MLLEINQPFDLNLTLKCGQGHRWRKTKEYKDWYTGVLDGDAVWIRQSNGTHSGIEFHASANSSVVETKLRWQFGLNDDIEIEDIYTRLSQIDGTMGKLVKCYRGLRVMRVDLWECLVFFILAVRSGIETTHIRMDEIAEAFRSGPPLWNGRYLFPIPTAIPEYDTRVPPELVELPLGLDKDIKVYIAGLHHSNQAFADLVEESSLEEILRQLREPLWGVGDKTANCVALFSLGKESAFPVDTHIYAALESLYGREPGFPTQKDPKNPYAPTVRKWAQKSFGQYAGWASQFLFIYDLNKTESKALAPH